MIRDSNNSNLPIIEFILKIQKIFGIKTSFYKI